MSDAPSLDAAERLMRRPPPSAILLGFEITAIDEAKGVATLSWTPKPEFGNPFGQIQGGFVSAVLDEAASIAGVVRSGFTGFVPTLEMKTSFYAPVRIEPLMVTGRVLKFGKSILFLASDLKNADGEILAAATQTARFLPRDKATKA